MIINVDVSIKDLKHFKKSYNWERPKKCPRTACQKKLWGHGFVLRHFNSSTEGVLLKRWRCSHCNLIIICRPIGYWRRYQETISNIFEALLFRIKQLKWPDWVTRQRGGHWLKTLISNAKIHLLKKATIVQTISFYKDKNLAIFN